MASTTLHLRAEDKILEHRSALTPSTTRSLLDAGYTIKVERSPTSPLRKRIFPDQEFEKAGAELVPEGSWVNAPRDSIIVGLKELDETKDFPLIHDHVTFAHCFKNQGGWEKALGRWSRGGGVLYDLEFLQDDSGRRVAAFGYHAGFAGAALSLKNWAWQLEHPDGTPLPGVDDFTGGKGYYINEDEMVNQIRADVERGSKIAGRKPRILIIGALGRCGRGAVDACVKAGCEDILRWDMEETAKGGPFTEIIESDIFINCIYLTSKIPPFVDDNSLLGSNRKLSVICDVSCDTTNPNNPIPIYSANSTFDKPTIQLKYSNPPLSVISIDHLPSLLPAESSNAFSADLLPSMLEIKNRASHPVWKRAENLYQEKVALLPAELQKREV
ncbi:Saccharopine dehydrogenase [Ophidiomyces ophidiicola]|uniref:Saccharopine dehydrogenase n=1 Tax=Ophidiomyces ophidiicola TaxID=1387563 RepID=A0ACB8V1A1_9EURO|nr:Saccharopine dehydrogenase [Ophidiomyces ophidiicola]KAI1909245.1 Saccharopine dehydrogenase [Ophidiomyces ophidiicola]KAI1912069.1 Saccharopine dehydrogenase [Ophidiomyces ophidiicola]KAI1927740.1 Saccharopine dehydrogenase [Ophidiomyces ophidiicola]KAI1937886.1 Saccharopine dehydrogenase [Ophidiomyces ophidiicola]KAI1950557.1 Saccharopine dehydrogenase [Ophidiomyces ophidiicola]